MRKLIIRIVIVLLVLAVVGGGGYAVWSYTRDTSTAAAVQSAAAEIGTLRITSSASGTVTAEFQVDIKSEASGEVLEVLVDPGDYVHKGDILVRLNPDDEERSLTKAQATLTTARASLAQAEAALASCKADAVEAKAKADRRTAALAAGLVSVEDERAARTSAETAQLLIAQREASVRSARASLEQASISIADAQERLNETTIRAPNDGTVLAVNVEAGSIVVSSTGTVGGGTTVITLADLSKVYIATSLDEAQIGTVKAGQRANIRVDAYPAQTFRGQVERITPLGTATSNVVTFAVKVAVTDDSATLLLPGMSADVEIVTAVYNDQLLIPVAGLRSERGDKYVLLNDKEQTRCPVTAGATDGINVAILSGLNEGDAVITAGVGSGTGAAASQRGGFSLFSPPRGGGRH
ncbi:MAG TPA: efflux RND transporter periplasmic adaptor subunit [bacterium]|nr:efflux RND transporter periplasmic adaptor subunit [bacterium]